MVHLIVFHYNYQKRFSRPIVKDSCMNLPWRLQYRYTCRLEAWRFGKASIEAFMECRRSQLSDLSRIEKISFSHHWSASRSEGRGALNLPRTSHADGALGFGSRTVLPRILSSVSLCPDMIRKVKAKIDISKYGVHIDTSRFGAAPTVECLYKMRTSGNKFLITEIMDQDILLCG